jgi:hypothetical protein
VVHDACATRPLVFEDQTIPAAQVQAAFLSALNMLYANIISAEEFLGNAHSLSEKKSAP